MDRHINGYEQWTGVLKTRLVVCLWVKYCSYKLRVFAAGALYTNCIWKPEIVALRHPFEVGCKQGERGICLETRNNYALKPRRLYAEKIARALEVDVAD